MATTAILGLGGGSEYSTFAAWQTGEEGNLTTFGGHVLTVMDDWASGLDETFTLSGSWTGETATDFITLTVDSAGRHDGTYQSGFFMSGNSGTNNTRLFTIGVDHTVMDWFDITNTRTAGATTAALGIAAEYVKINQGIFQTNSDMAVYPDIGNFGFAYAVYPQFKNCWFHDSNIGIYTNDSDRGRYRCYNCVASDNGLWGFTEGGTNIPEVINCIAYNNTTADFESGTYTTASDNNASSDTSADTEFTTGINSLTSGNFVSAGTDYHLAASSALEGQGIGNSSNSDIPTIDIDGDSRSTTAPDIGFDEFVAAGGGLGIPIAMYHYQHNIGSKL